MYEASYNYNYDPATAQAAAGTGLAIFAGIMIVWLLFVAAFMFIWQFAL